MVEKIEIAGQDWHIKIAEENEKRILLEFRNNDFRSVPFNEEKRTMLKKDIQDWGKWRKFKELKKDLEK